MIICPITMSKKAISIALSIVLLGALSPVHSGSATAKERISLSPSSMKAKAYGMGGAFTAVLDGSSGVLFNPAALELYRFPKTSRLTFFLNPIGGIEALRSKAELRNDGKIDGLDWFSYAGMLCKSIVYSRPDFSVSLLLAEELPRVAPTADSNEFFTSSGLLDRSYSVCTSRLRLAKQISIGASGILVTAKDISEKRREFAASYGVLIQPSDKICIGMAYFDFPQAVAGLFSLEDRIIDETINVGVSYRPHHTLLLAADLRNASEEQRTVKRELHLGVDYAPFSFIALRAGFFHQKDENKDVFSAGISLLNSNLFHSEEDQFFAKDFVLNYAVQANAQAGRRDYKHYLTMTIRI